MDPALVMGGYGALLSRQWPVLSGGVVASQGDRYPGATPAIHGGVELVLSVVSDRAARLCMLVLEAGWLVTVLAVPVYFNIDDMHIFEPDKAILLRDAAALLTVLAALLLLLRSLGSPPVTVMHTRSPAEGSTVGRADGHDSLARHGRPVVAALRRAVRRRPTLVPMLTLAAVTLLATTTSILPDVSWGGSYARGQGALTMLAYLAMGLLALGLVRTPAQARRLVAAMALSGVAPAAYGWVQRVGRDPLPWQQADVTTRVPGTLGNPIFLGALLVMTIPLALYNLALTLRPDTAVPPVPPPIPDAPTRPQSPESRPRLPRRMLPWRYLGALGWAVVAVVEIGGLFFTNSRGPFAGFIVALAVLGLGLSRAWGLRRLGRLSMALTGVAAVVLVGTNVLGPAALGHVGQGSPLRLIAWMPQESGSSEVRLLIWRPALDLVAQRPLLGCGPDTLLSCYYPVYPTALRHVEAPNAVPDRTHDIFLDAATETGLLGLAAFLALLGVTAATLARLVVRGRRQTERVIAAGLLAALLGHVAEGVFGIAVVDTLLLTWLIAGLAGGLSLMDVSVDIPPATIRRSGATARHDDPVAGRRVERRARPVGAGAPTPLGISLAAAAGGLLSLGEDMPPPVRVGATRASSGWRGETLPGPGRLPASTPARGVRALALCGVVAACWVAWQVVTIDTTTTAADVSARRGADLETVALGNAGQAPLPPGRTVHPVLALRQFAAASVAEETAMRLAPDQEEYALDAGRTLVEWGQAAASVGGPAAAQAGSLYARALLLFGQAARLNPYDPDPLRDTGKAYERWAGLGRDLATPTTWNGDLLARAAQAFARAADLAPHHPDPLTSGAQVALWQGQPRQARDLADRALALDDRDGDGYRLRADAEMALGQRDDALTDWRRALVDPMVGQRGQTAAHLALAEATWARARCAAVTHGKMALSAGGLSSHDAAMMAEIIRVDGRQCLSLRHG